MPLLIQHKFHPTSCILYCFEHSSPAEDSLVDILVVDNLVGNLVEGSPADSPVDTQADSSLPDPEVRIVADQAKSIRLVKGWSSRSEVVGSDNRALERECGLGRDCRDRRLDG